MGHYQPSAVQMGNTEGDSCRSKAVEMIRPTAQIAALSPDLPFRSAASVGWSTNIASCCDMTT
eukprot:5051688-Prymnesium_polylepis.2